MQSRVARATETTEPLTAAHHYLEAGAEPDAMRCLASSVIATMGSGQWGVASELIDHLQAVHLDPVLAAIRARTLLEAGDFDAARKLLISLDAAAAPPDVRAVIRHARLSLGFRSDDRDLLFSTLAEIQSERDTPSVLADIFQIYVDASPLATNPVPFAALASRMERMAISQRETGYSYFSAISFHNAAQTMFAAYRLHDVVRLGNEALAAFEAIPLTDADKYSTHALLGVARLEQGSIGLAEEHFRSAVASGIERADVHAEYAYSMACIGNFARANQILLSAEQRDSEGKSDVAARMLVAFTRATMAMGDAPRQAAAVLDATPSQIALDTGYVLERQMLLSLCDLLADNPASALAVSEDAMLHSRARGAARVLTRLNLIHALAGRDGDRLKEALVVAAHSGHGAILTTADAIGGHLWLVPSVPEEILNSIRTWPQRWLPILRRQLNTGATPNAFLAARLLDEHGEPGDIVRLKAFAKTYRRHSKAIGGIGVQLSRRVAPILQIEDLGRTQLALHDRSIEIGSMRRKAAALLMFLVTRPGYSATRDQTLDQLARVRSACGRQQLEPIPLLPTTRTGSVV